MAVAGITSGMFWSAIKRKRLRFYKVGHALRVRSEDLAAWLAQREVGFSILETAAQLAVSRATVYRLLQRGELRTLPQEGKRLRIDPASIERLRSP
jgi:excisionase family DNA binding protein